MKTPKIPYPKTKRFTHICKTMRLTYPDEWINLLGVDSSGHWEFWIADNKFEIFYCPFCGRNLNETFSLWSSSGLWEK